MWTRARWLLKAGPTDYMLAMSVASASLPVIGKHLEPLGAATAMGIWGYRHMPDFLGATAQFLVRARATPSCDSRNAMPPTPSPKPHCAASWPPRIWRSSGPRPRSAPPLWKLRQHRRSVHRTSVRYGDHPSQLLDVWRRKDLPAEPAPVLIFVPGGAWVHGSRLLQGYALMSHLAEHGLGVPVHRLPGRATPPLARSTSPTSRRRSRGRAPTSTSSAATAISLRSRDVRRVATWRRWPV